MSDEQVQTPDPQVKPVDPQPKAVTLGTLLGILVEIDTDLPKLVALLNEVDANPAIWTLPGLNKLKPYEQLAKDWIPFLLELDEALIKVLS
jgi:hypothetical protein